MFVLLFLASNGSAAAQETGDTGDTGATTTNPTTVTETGTGTDSGFDTASICYDCLGAAELAGEKGGSACDEGCSTTSTPSSLIGAALIALVARRRTT